MSIAAKFGNTNFCETTIRFGKEEVLLKIQDIIMKCLYQLVYSKLSLSLTILFLSNFYSFGQFSGAGSGTDVDPYIITTPTHLGEMRNDLTAYYRLGNDINMSIATSNASGEFYNDGLGWDPLDEFTGSLDGNTQKIISLYINRTSENEVGLISRTGTGSEISALGMVDVDITGNLQVGSLVGWNRLGGSISRCFSSGTINGAVSVGGLVGENWDGVISESYTDVIVTSLGNSEDNDFAGGIVGILDGGSINDCFSIGSVRGTTKKVGGIAGANFDNGTITNTYALGYVSGTDETGAILGINQSGTVTNAYFHLFGTDQTEGIGAGAVVTGTTGLNNAQMVQEASFTGFNFTTIWTITESQTAPSLQSNPSDPLPEPNTGPFLVGKGTEGDPWQITTIEQLNEVRNYNDNSFILMNDLDLTSATGSSGGIFYNSGAGWDPIDAFTGTFNGGGFTIDGLFISRTSEDNIGLFGSSFGSILRNVVLTDVDVSGQQSVGGLIGRATTQTHIDSVGIRGQVEASNGNAGGIVGFMADSDIRQSYSAGSVTGTGTSVNIGGLAGVQNLTGSLDLGIQDSYSFSDVSGDDKVGGIAGATNSSKITNCYYSGFLSSQENFSDLYGGNSNFTVVLDSYWNAEPNCSIGGSNVSELQMQSTYENWDFSSVWGFQSGRLPHLLWQGMSEDHNNSAISAVSIISDLPDIEADCQIEGVSPHPFVEVCGVQNLGVADISFPITEDGTTVVTWTFTDALGRVETRTQNFIINPDVNSPVPQVTNLPDLTDECSINVEESPLADDTCWGEIMGQANVTFPIVVQGTTVVTWTYEDGEGNESTQTQNVIIDDQTPPVPDLAELPEINEVCVRNAISPPTATDNCSGQTDGTTDAVFPITTQGTTIVTWTFTDDNGNSITQDQNVTINDVELPVPSVTVLPVLFTDCDGVVSQPGAPTANDNCSGILTASTNQVFPFSSSTDTQILWEYDDGNGNTQIQFQDVVIIQSDEVTVNESLCEGTDFTFPDGTAWTGQATQLSTLTNQQGCDSLVTTNITVLALPEVDLGDEIVFGCVDEDLTFSIDESAISFDTYTISTLLGHSSTDGPLTFTFDQGLASIAATQDFFVLLELTDANGCRGTDQVLLKDNTMVNWGIGAIQNNDPAITISSTVLPETADLWEWDFGDGTTNVTDVNPSYTYTENGDYIITLTVTNECGDESLSTTISITAIEEVTPLGISDSFQGIVYPNPTSEFLFLANDQPVSARLFSLDGKKIITSTVEADGKLDVSSLDAGQYILYLYDGDHLLAIEKIIKKN